MTYVAAAGDNADSMEMRSAVSLQPSDDYTIQNWTMDKEMSYMERLFVSDYDKFYNKKEDVS